MDEQKAVNLLKAIQNQERVNGLTHTYYRYPARFSPVFARAVIEIFSNKGDVVFDPFMGGGTTLVEASALGRVAIGSDINSLAVFISRVKTTPLNDDEIRDVQKWAVQVKNNLNIRGKVDPNSHWRELGYHRNISCRRTWRIRKIVDVALYQTNIISTDAARDLVRCSILKTAQWALDCRDDIPSVELFRRNLLFNLNEMIEGAKQYSTSLKDYHGSSVIYQHSAIDIDISDSIKIPTPKLILTSPPYPGVHILYHRWQIMGRRETPAPYWIANCYDSKGESYYTFGGRNDKELHNYYESLKAAFTSIANISNEQTTLVQVMSFKNAQEQFPMYLEVIKKCGFSEVYIPCVSEQFEDGRLWRSVPHKKWYTAKKTSSNNEVVLFHRLTSRFETNNS